MGYKTGGVCTAMADAAIPATAGLIVVHKNVCILGGARVQKTIIVQSPVNTPPHSTGAEACRRQLAKIPFSVPCQYRTARRASCMSFAPSPSDAIFV